MAEDKMEGEDAAWKYEHPTDHPDNKPPVTLVAVPSDEEVEKYEASINAELAKGQPDVNLVPQALEPPPVKVQLVDGKESNKDKEPIDYEAHTVDELKEIAHKRGIDVAWDARKADLVKALEKHDKAK
jgi:hypothetical protein